MHKLTLLEATPKCPFCNRELTSGKCTGHVYPNRIDVDEKSETKAALNSSKDEKVYCKTHDFTYIYWCRSHEELICKLCAVQQHKHCDTVITDGNLDDIKSSLHRKNQASLARSNEALKVAEERLQKCTHEANIINRFCQTVYNFRNQFKQIIDKYTEFKNQVEMDIRNLEENPKKLVILDSYSLRTVTLFLETVSAAAVKCCDVQPLNPLENLLVLVAEILQVRFRYLVNLPFNM